MPTSDFGPFETHLARLAAKFDKEFKTITGPGYPEARLRDDYLNPFFRALGWDLENAAALIQSQREVEIESRTDIAGRAKRADYLFRTDARDRFVCEAKKPRSPLGPRDAFQAKRYAFNMGLPLAVLSDFEEIKVYVVGGRPHIDRPDEGLWKTWNFRQYPLLAREIWGLLARENIAAGSIDTLLDTLPKRAPAARGGKARQAYLIKPDRTRALDADFLTFLDEARHDLASSIRRHNPGSDLLAGDGLNAATQHILDRLLFIRICEDRDIDTGRRLDSIVDIWRNQFNRPGSLPAKQASFLLDPATDADTPRLLPADSLWSAVVAHFRALDHRAPGTVPFFNGQLFKHHFSEDLLVGDKWLAGFIARLSDDESPYLFNIIPVEILGSVYERFLGKVIRPHGTGVRTEEKPEVRKAGGVYYTPRYIVDYIVEQTVGKLAGEIAAAAPKFAALEKRSRAVHILDPACGSGSFLIRAFERMCEHWLAWFTAHPEDRKKKDCWVEETTNDVHLTVDLKRRILRDNIFGVDLDPQAVEVTQLSLYLKMLEGETRQTLARERELFGEAIALLPPLDANIKCGNSLLASDFSLVAEDLYRVRAFDWSVQFREIMKAGGFDAVIGNPPWLMAGYYLDMELDYLRRTYSSATGKFDLYYCFIEQGIKLLSDSGRYGVIVPNKFLHTRAATALRMQLAKSRAIERICDFGDAQLFEGATNYSALVFATHTMSDTLHYSKVTVDLATLESCDVRYGATLGSGAWNLGRSDLAQLFDKIRVGADSLEKLTKRFGTGCQTGADKILTTVRAQQNDFDAELLRPIIRGRDVRRYCLNVETKLAIFPYESTRNEFRLLKENELREYAETYAYLEEHRRKLDDRIWFGKSAAELSGAWYGYVYLDKKAAFDAPHILTPSLSDRANFSIGSGDLFLTGTAGVTSIIPAPNVKESIKYLLALLNSPLLAVYIVRHSPPFSGGFFKFSAPYLKNIPIRRIDFTSEADKKIHDSLVGLVDKMLDLTPKLRAEPNDAKRAVLENAIAAADADIDDLVYKLYALTPEEIALVEAAAP